MILLTGGAGYIGSHSNKLLVDNGYATVVFDNLVYGHKEAVRWGKLEIGDLADRKRIEEVFCKYDIEAVLHFAAYAYVGESVVYPAKYYNNNVVNTLHLLDCMVKYKVRYLVFSSTCATYGIPTVVPITEDMPQIPINPYGASKQMIERILKDYHNAYDLQYCCLRYFNAAGADPEGEIGESHIPETHLLPLILQTAAGELEAIRVFGTDYPTKDGSCIRDYIHVADLAKAHLQALEYLKKNDKSVCLNLGNGRGNSVLEIIDAARKVTGKKIPIVYDTRRAGDPPILVGSAQKAERLLGWKPHYGAIETILAHAWQWQLHKSY